MRPFVESIQDLKENRIEIIEEIKSQLTLDYKVAITDKIVVAVMKRVAMLVTASNYIELDYDIYETIERSIEDEIRSADFDGVVDMGEINRENAKKNAPSSLRQ